MRRRLIVMAKSHLKLISPTTENRTVTPRRRPNAESRTREYLTDAEVARLQEAAKANRWGHRDATMILVAYRHGFRAIELVDLRWDQIDFEAGTLAVRRVKKGSPRSATELPSRAAAILLLGSVWSPSRYPPVIERSSGASPNAAIAISACSSCRPPVSFCFGQGTG